MEVPRREPGNQTNAGAWEPDKCGGCHHCPLPSTILVPRLPPGNARQPRLRLGFSGGACKPWRFPGGSRGTRQVWEPGNQTKWARRLSRPCTTLVPRLPPGNARHHSRSQAPAWGRTAPFSFPGSCLGTHGTRGSASAFQAEPVNHGGSQAGAWEPDIPRREPGNQTSVVAVTIVPTRAPFSFPGSCLGTHGTRGSASAFQAEPVNHGGSQAGAWEPDKCGSRGTRQVWWLSPLSPPVHHSRSQAGAWGTRQNRPAK